jgi:hypothetical protein
MKTYIVQAWVHASMHAALNCNDVYTVRAASADEAAKHVLSVCDSMGGTPRYDVTDTYENNKAARFCGQCFRGDTVPAADYVAPKSLKLVCSDTESA